jgi:hypothetical protein
MVEHMAHEVEVLAHVGESGKHGILPCQRRRLFMAWINRCAAELTPPECHSTWNDNVVNPPTLTSWSICMTIKFDSNSLLAAAVGSAQFAGSKSLSTPTMAPVSLTPLVPPSVGPLSPNTAAPHRESGPNERWRDFFADKQHALLIRLGQGGTEPSVVPRSSLSAAQREACIAVLGRITAAVSAAE